MLCLPAADATFHHGLLIVILLVAALACRLPSSSCHGDGLDSILNRGLHLLTVAPLSRCHNLHTIDMNHKTMSPLLSPSDPVGGIRRGRDVDRCRSTSLPPHPVLPLRTLCRRSSGCRPKLAPQGPNLADLPVPSRTGDVAHSMQCSRAFSHLQMCRR